MSTGNKIKSALKHSPLGGALIPRRFQAYYLGAPKTGTTSVAEMMKVRYRAQHEALEANTPEYVIAAHRGTKTREQLSEYLLWRDRELRLEMESSHPMTVFAGLLGELFPRAKFVLAFREPRSWLSSIINMRINRGVHRFEPVAPSPRQKFHRELNDIYFRERYPEHPPEELLLKDLGLFTLDGYLSGWADYQLRVLQSVPADRLLVIRVGELSDNPTRLARFLGIPVETLNLQVSHSHQADKRHSVLERLDPELLQAKIDTHCRDVLIEFRQRLAS